MTSFLVAGLLDRSGGIRGKRCFAFSRLLCVGGSHTGGMSLSLAAAAKLTFHAADDYKQSRL